MFQAERPFFLLFSFESFKAYSSTFPSPYEVCTHFPTFPPTFRCATTPLAIVSEKICSHNMNKKLLYSRYRSRKMCCWLAMYSGWKVFVQMVNCSLRRFKFIWQGRIQRGAHPARAPYNWIFFFFFA